MSGLCGKISILLKKIFSRIFIEGDDAAKMVAGRWSIKKAWKKVKTVVKENVPRIVGAVTFIAGSALLAFPILGPVNVWAGSILIASGTMMMKENIYYIGIKAVYDPETDEWDPKK